MSDNARHPLLTEIHDFLARAGMSASYFGKRAVNNSELVARLEAGGDVHSQTAERIRSFIRANSPPESTKGDAA